MGKGREQAEDRDLAQESNARGRLNAHAIPCTCTCTRGIVVGLALLTALVALCGCVYLDHNLRAVEPGRFYRSGQMPDTCLGDAIRRHGIRTVVNLRGAHPEEEWYREEVAVCEALGVAHYDFAWSKDRLPEPESLAEFVRVCSTAETPILIHCQGGTHRSGAASAVYRLLRGQDVAAARREFHLFFNNAPIGQLLGLYDGSDMPFDQWVSREYPQLYVEFGKKCGSFGL